MKKEGLLPLSNRNCADDSTHLLATKKNKNRAGDRVVHGRFRRSGNHNAPK